MTSFNDCIWPAIRNSAISIVVIISLCSNLTHAGEKLLWGPDNRKEIFLADHAVRAAAMSVLALVPWKHLTRTRFGYKLVRQHTLRNDHWCDDEPYSKQHLAAICSGFFVGGNRIVTAKHCVNQRLDDVRVSEMAAVFSFALSQNQINFSIGRWEFSVDSVYPLEKILVSDESGVENNDWAIVSLKPNQENKYPSSPPVNFRYATSAIGDELIIIGHPLGLPKKYAIGKALQRDQNSPTVFRAAIDSYQGDSGAPIFVRNELGNELELVGLMSRGGKDYFIENNCRRSAVCRENSDENQQRCDGEILVPVESFRSQLGIESE